MDLLKFRKPKGRQKDPTASQASMADIALKAIHDGVIMTDKSGVVQFINPAAVTMTECGSANRAIGLDYGLVIKLESKEGRELAERENPLIQAMSTGQPLEPTQVALITSQSNKRIPIAISMHLAEGNSGNRIITFRDIAKELEEEGEQTEFISTASHEMRTPVATIDGYLSLCLNPQTATIDERARGYLTAAQAASKHLGQLFRDLLDVTKLDDNRLRPKFVPVEMVDLVKSISDDYLARAKETKITFSFGSSEPITLGENRRMAQVVYGFVDIDFMREILDNLIENALKYTPSGGSIYVNVRGDGDRILINVTDTGIGISADDLGHIFQKFYRADNSDTREIGGTGLGLYLTKQRVEAMGGKIWAESAFGEGSTFYVSLPRLTNEEYEKRMIAVRNQQLQPQPASQLAPRVIPQPVSPTPTVQPQPAVPLQSVVQPQQITQPQPTIQPQPALQPQPTTMSPQTTPQLVQPVPPTEPTQAPQPVQAPRPVQSTPLQTSPPPQAQSIPATPPAPPLQPPRPIQPTQLPQNQINNNLNGGIK